jgi:hypothetical protein
MFGMTVLYPRNPGTPFIGDSGGTVQCTGFDYGKMTVKTNEKSESNLCLHFDDSESTIISTGDIPVV